MTSATANYRVVLVRSLTFLGGIYFFLRFVLPEEIAGVTFSKFDQEINYGFLAIGAMTFGLGLINLFMVHGSKIVFRRKGWGNSGALLAGFFAMVVVTVLDWRAGANLSAAVEQVTRLKLFAERSIADVKAHTPGVPALSTRSGLLVDAAHAAVRSAEAQVERHLQVDQGKTKLLANYGADFAEKGQKLREALEALSVSANDPDRMAALSGVGEALALLAVAYRGVLTVANEQSTQRKVYNLFFTGLYSALGSAMFALLGFYIATAAYRAFRVRSPESGLMMMAALLVMLGQIPFGIWLWSDLPEVRLWVLTTPSAGARRAIEIGASIAGLVMAFRMWLSIESESFTAKKS